MQRAGYIPITILLTVALSGCGSGGGGSSLDTASCPTWGVGSTMTYDRTTTVDGVATTTSSVYTVTEHSATAISLSDGTTLKTFTIVDGNYLPATEGSIGNTIPDTYTSTTPFCPPPSIGDQYAYQTWIPSPAGRGGDYYAVTLVVTGVTMEGVTISAGTFTAKKIVMTKDGYTLDPVTYLLSPLSSTVIRYYVSGVGVVKEVEDTPSTSTVVTDELMAYTQ